MLSFISRIGAFRMLKTRDRGVLLLMGLMLFFFVLFDGIMSFVSPLIVSEHGVSGTMLGLIIGASSFAGALFDIILCRVLPHTNFRRLFILTFALAIFFPLFMWIGSSAWVFLLGMGSMGSLL